MANVGEALDEAYLTWLYGLVASNQNRNPANSHRRLLAQLYISPFDGFVPNDDNRAADGKDLRIEFLQSTGYPLIDPYGSWFDIKCSMLEMIIALARHASFMDESGHDPIWWFWLMMRNLELERYTDDIFEISIQEEVEEIMSRLNAREYLFNGVGGLFPLVHAIEDQRKVELWTQLSAYLNAGDYANSVPRW